MKARLELVIENGVFHFYTEYGERIDFLTGTKVDQFSEHLWTAEIAEFETGVFVGMSPTDKLKSCKYNEQKKQLTTPNGHEIASGDNIVQVITEQDESEPTLIIFKGTCFLSENGKTSMQ